MPQFDAPFHFHPEYELTLIVKGEGQRFVGKQVDNFSDGDLVFLGSHLPHCWINHQKENQTELSEAIVVQFNQHFLGEDFFNLNEFVAIKMFLDKSKAGFDIQGNDKIKITNRLFEIINATPMQQILILMDILDLLSRAVQLKPLDLSFAENDFKVSETNRFQKVFSYLITHYKEDISLAKIAGIADLSPTSFCRYFRSITQQSFVEVLLEFRIKQACHLLLNTDMAIREIAFQSGFYDVPYFNRIFKKKKGISPKQYKKDVKFLPDKYIVNNNGLPA
jgi:AraC-like DNA-binding protein